MSRADALDVLCRRARESDSAMVRVLSRSEIEWLVEPLLAMSEAAEDLFWHGH